MLKTQSQAGGSQVTKIHYAIRLIKAKYIYILKSETRTDRIQLVRAISAGKNSRPIARITNNNKIFIFQTPASFYETFVPGVSGECSTSSKFC